MLEGRAGPEETRTVVTICHRIAKAYLQTSYVTNRSLAGLTLGDQAMDAIADLFERSGRRFPVLEGYFREPPELIGAMSTDEMIERLRPLVHGVVTDRIFESNGEVDASLSRLIRSVKRAVKQSEGSTLQRTMKALHVVVPPANVSPEDSSRSVSLPTMPVERLAAHLAPVVRSGAQVPDFVAAATHLLDAHPRYDRSVPVTAIALAIRAASVEVGLSTTASGHVASVDNTIRSDGLDNLVTSDIERLIDKTIDRVRAEKQSHYVEGNQVPANVYASYFEAIRSYLEARYLPPTDADLTQHEALRMHRSEITREIYRECHRSTFEYLVRIVRDDFVETLQRLHDDIDEP
ncbi:hypothetical protein CRI94_16405 [Longibacter salinarum]|uniref:Uncharacterized protein n=1 Tax=Longibacter salinarum TaxID=1850348 RepID=A0A2A8CTW7_9BACT|nr:hypothetical protein [Longibacter salinarum]PEN11171.1 hypothetical protein CRI94_16405 [Longibacter salinarum]